MIILFIKFFKSNISLFILKNFETSSSFEIYLYNVIIDKFQYINFSYMLQYLENTLQLKYMFIDDYSLV